jgi:disulfide bond formation protein DsbB
MSLTEIIIQALSALTLLSQAVILLFLIAWVGKGFPGPLKSIYDSISNMAKKNALLFGFVVAATAALGSLYFSEIAKYVPCKLCWFQRILMYPQAIILGIACFRKDRNIFRYTAVLSAIGMMVSAYHYLMQVMPQQVLSCSADGISCSSSQFLSFGYITIPMMALTAFAIVSLLSIIQGSHASAKRSW